jgi:hypothetical protein
MIGKNSPLVIPGRPEGPDLESITPVCVYGFQVRRFAALANGGELSA